jgi:protein-disulfide isomerase
MGKAARAKAERRLFPSPAAGPARSRDRAGPSTWTRPAWLTPTRTLLIGLAAALVVAGALIGISVAGAGSSSKPSPAKLTGVFATNALFRGIPQKGNVLGDPKAPATLVEFAEPQCPICGAWARGTLPTIVRDYVRTGKLRLVFRGIAFIQPTSDSERALGALAAAGAQSRQFQLLDLLYRNQGEEGSGWITDDILRSLGSGVFGLDVRRMMDERSSEAAKAQIRETMSAATRVMGSQFKTPTFLAGRSGGTLAPMPIATYDQLGPAGFAALLDQMTGR